MKVKNEGFGVPEFTGGGLGAGIVLTGGDLESGRHLASTKYNSYRKDKEHKVVGNVQNTQLSMLNSKPQGMKFVVGYCFVFASTPNISHDHSDHILLASR